jgi:acid phosphatase type 7
MQIVNCQWLIIKGMPAVNSYLKYLLFFFSLNAFAQSPDRVILNLTSEPSTSMAVTWQIDGSREGIVEYAVSTPWTQFTKHVSTVSAVREDFVPAPGKSSTHFSAVLKNLKPETRYIYRVGTDSGWTEWNQFSTGSTTAKPFSFVWFGDPQNDIREHCSRIFRQAFQTCGSASFWLFSGDMTSEPEDDQIGELFTAAGFIFRTMPSVLVPGNHDMAYRTENGRFVLNAKGSRMRIKEVAPSWHAYYTLPENGIKGMEETSYTFEYQGVRFLMLNSNDRLAEQAAWMENLLSRNTTAWTIAVFHHPIYSTGNERDQQGTREAFQRIFDKYHVDLVLTGHDHTYSRSKKIRNGEAVPDSGQGTVYIVSVSGPKQYFLNPRYKDLMAKMGSDIQLFQSISVDGRRLHYSAYQADGVLYDSFELNR